MKKIRKILPLIYCTAFFLFSFGDSMAESNMAPQSSSATASLNFKIHIPATLYLQIGTITQKKDEDASDVNPENKTRPVSQDKKSYTVKMSGLICKSGMIFLSSGSNNLTNGLHSKTACYILCSPWFFHQHNLSVLFSISLFPPSPNYKKYHWLNLSQYLSWHIALFFL